MIEEKEIKEIKMPVCPFCKSEMRPYYFHGYYESFPMWECKCEEIPGSEVSRGAYA